MYPEPWLHDLAWERQREMRELAVGSVRRGIGGECRPRQLPNLGPVRAAWAADRSPQNRGEEGVEPTGEKLMTTERQGRRQ